MAMPEVVSDVVDLDGIPLTEMQALGSDVLKRAIGRATPGTSAPAVRGGAFQSGL
jgi:hypothetical protein